MEKRPFLYSLRLRVVKERANRLDRIDSYHSSLEDSAIRIEKYLDNSAIYYWHAISQWNPRYVLALARRHILRIESKKLTIVS
jgi:hypothetical protein